MTNQSNDIEIASLFARVSADAQEYAVGIKNVRDAMAIGSVGAAMSGGNKRQLVLSEPGKNQATIDGSVCVWKAIISNHERANDSPWEIHVLARDIHDAVAVAQDVADTLPESDYAIVSSVMLVGAYGLFAAADVAVVPSFQYKKWHDDA